MNKKKGQAALEFLMTYGWAILVVLIVIGALAYFGILNPSILLPEKCTLQMGLYCKDHRIDGANNKIMFELENGMGKDIIIYTVNVTGDILPGGCYAGVINISSPTGAPYAVGAVPFPEFNTSFNAKRGLRIPQSDLATVTVNCSRPILSAIGKSKTNLLIRWYYADSSLTYLHTMEGELLAKVEGQ